MTFINVTNFIVGLIAAMSSIGSVQAQDDQIVQLLHEDLWTKRDAYDAAHILMVPMHDAYHRKSLSEIGEYRSFFERYRVDTKKDELNKLTQLQFNYLVSRFVLLDTKDECSDQARYLTKNLLEDWRRIALAPARLWTMPDFSTLLARVEWKLNPAETELSYIPAVSDEDLFALSIAADLTRALPRCGLDVTPEVKRAHNLAIEVFDKLGEFKDGGWLFQPGVWRDHPDYAHAGQTKLGPNLPKKLVDNIAWDSSHSARFPLWFNSVYCSINDGGEEQKAMRRIIDGFRSQFVEKVIIPADDEFGAVRLKNYMDGQNGLYRYGYATVGTGGGYGPSGLSFTFNLGWWSFLGEGVRGLYQKQLEVLPFSDKEMSLYLQPVVTIKSAPRERHPRFEQPSYLKGDLIKSVLRAAVSVSSKTDTCN